MASDEILIGDDMNFNKYIIKAIHLAVYYKVTNDITNNKDTGIKTLISMNSLLEEGLPIWYNNYFRGLTYDKKSISDIGKEGQNKYELSRLLINCVVKVIYSLRNIDANILDDRDIISSFYNVLWTIFRTYGLYSCNTINLIKHIMLQGNHLRENYIKTICNPSCADNICINAKNKSDESDEKNMYECGRAMSYDIWSSGNAARIYIHAGEDGNFFPIIFDGVDINDSKYDNKVKDNTCVIPNHRTQQESASAAQTGGKHYKQKNKIYKLKYLNKIN